MTLMRHFLTAHPNKTAQSHRMTSTTPWFWQMLGSTAFICLGLVSEGLACHTPGFNPTSLTYYAVQGATNPPNKTITFSRTASGSMTLTASDNATWLTVSPATKSMTTSATLTSAVSTSGRAAGTYNATITLKMGTWCTYTVPVTVTISPPSGGGGGTTSSAALAWNAVTGTTLSGYKVYVGEAPHLYTRTITVGTVTSTTVSSLTRGRTYYFAVTAYNSAGQSPTSNEVSKTIP
jgi:Fibronectin type III domain